MDSETWDIIKDARERLSLLLERIRGKVDEWEKELSSA